MIIDVHNHPDWLGYTVSKFLTNMDEHGIDVTWLLTWDCPADEYDPGFHNVMPPVSVGFGPMPLELCLPYAEKAPDRFVLGYAPDPPGRIPSTGWNLR